MGFWKLLKNTFNDEGSRESVRLAYEKFRREAEAGKVSVPDASPHQIGLYCTLAYRRQAHIRLKIARAESAAEPILWAELVPFMHLPEAEAVEALAEYMVAIELPGKEDVARLIALLKKGLDASSPDEREIPELADRGGAEIPWLRWL